MGAFDGYRYGIKILHDEDCSTKSFDDTYEYFSNQSAFRFFKGFGIEELKLLLADAEDTGHDNVWIPRERPVDGCVGLSTWYVRALIKQHVGDT